MAASFIEGDILTLAFTEGNYLLAKIVYVEDLTLQDLVHLMIYDVVLDEGPAGYDAQGELQERTHLLPDIATLGVVVDHIALTTGALDDCDPLVVEHQDVTDQDRRGYAAWVARRRDRLVERGLIRDDAEEEEEEWEDEYAEDGEAEEEGEYEEGGEEESVDADDTEDAVNESGEQTIETEEGEFITLKLHTWHDTYYDISIAQALVELADVFRKEEEEFAGSVVARLIIEQTEASAEEIRALVTSLVEEGDYGAGQDLLLFGDPAADALYVALKETKDEQTATDVLQILADIGGDRAYEHIAEFFVNRIDRLPDDPIAVAAARTFCYVVMLTGGTPEPLRNHLRLIERLDYPGLRSDAEEAIRAIEEQGTEVPEAAERRSTDPFASL